MYYVYIINHFTAFAKAVCGFYHKNESCRLLYRTPFAA